MKTKRVIVIDEFEEQGARVLFIGTDDRTGERISFHLSRKQAKGPIMSLAAGQIVTMELPERKAP